MPKTHTCSNLSCLNIFSLKCANKMCKLCCDCIGYDIYKKIHKTK